MTGHKPRKDRAETQGQLRRLPFHLAFTGHL